MTERDHRVRVPGIPLERLSIGTHICDWCEKEQVCAQITGNWVRGATLCASCLAWLAQTVTENTEAAKEALAHYLIAMEERRRKDNTVNTEYNKKIRAEGGKR